MTDPPHERATLGGGCFWCLEAVFERLRGIHRVVSGYAGGHVPDPSYESVCAGATGHAEVVQITFDPSQITYRELLEIFFATHDPTTPARQGPDVGTQYRSIILVHTEQHKSTALEVVRELERDAVFSDPIVTEIVPFTDFFPAEDYHQGYYRKNPDQAYCQIVIAPKLEKARKLLAEKLA